MSGGDIRLELHIPRSRIELGEPIAERLEFLAGKFADRTFDLVNGCSWPEDKSLGFRVNCGSIRLPKPSERYAPVEKSLWRQFLGDTLQGFAGEQIIRHHIFFCTMQPHPSALPPTDSA
jgi:hypothetical protein